MIRGGDDLERLYLVDDDTLGVKRTYLGDDVFVRSVKRYEYAAGYVKAGDVVLDCACGSGYGSQILRNAGAAEVLGVDHDSVTVQYATKHYGGGGVRFSCQEISHLTLPERFFDVVVSIETIEHIQGGEVFLKQLYTSLKPGGKAVISTPLAEKSGRSPVNPYHLQEYCREDFQRLVESVFDATTYFIPTEKDMPLKLTDQATFGLIFAVGRKL